MDRHDFADKVVGNQSPWWYVLMAFVFVALTSFYWHRSPILLGLNISGLVAVLVGLYLALWRRRGG